MTKTLLRSALFLSLFALTACGEGWEKQLTNTVFPYGNQRTAGSGVMYVRAKMLPRKELKIVPAQRDRKPLVRVMPEEQPDTEVKDMEPVFRKKQEK